MMAKSVTDKQEKYIQALIRGETQRVAYREAYPSSRKWKDASVDVAASNLIKNSKVILRYNEVKEQIAKEHKEKNLWSLEKATEELLWMIFTSKEDIQQQGFRQANSTAFINAIKELNELDGLGKERSAKVALDEAKVEKIKKETGGEESQENILKDYLEALGKAVKDDELA